MNNFNYGQNLMLGGLMGASPYSNMSLVLDPRLRQLQLQQRSGNGQPQRQPLLNQRPSAFYHPNQKQTQLKDQTQLLQHQQLFTPPLIKFKIADRVIQDLLCRFIMNIPEEERFDPVRVLFQVELAHWFYIDHYCADEGDQTLSSSRSHIPFNQFAYIIFKEAPHLRQYFAQVDKYLLEFRQYRSRVPTFGAILMNQELTQALLVQGFKNQWGFPKGKVNETEDPVECAIREVFEETGYDMRPLINPNHFIESKTQERNDRLYLVRGVEISFPFHPQTQYEIKNISWFNIDELPEHKKDLVTRELSHGQSVSNFFTIYPYIKRLKIWIADKITGNNRIPCFRSKYNERDEEENCNLDESYSIESQYNSTGLSEGQMPRKPNSAEEQVRQAFAELFLTPSTSNQASKPNDTKGIKIKKRLFSPTSEVTRFSETKNAANFLCSAMGIPVNVKSTPSAGSRNMKSPIFSKQNDNNSRLTIGTTGSQKASPMLEALDKVTTKSWDNKSTPNSGCGNLKSPIFSTNNDTNSRLSVGTPQPQKVFPSSAMGIPVNFKSTPISGCGNMKSPISSKINVNNSRLTVGTPRPQKGSPMLEDLDKVKIMSWDKFNWDQRRLLEALQLGPSFT